MSELNFFDPTFLEDPYPVYDRLRAEDPVHRHPFGFYALTRFDDVAAFLRDPRFDKHGYQELFERRFGGAPEASWFALSMLFRDPPDHTRLRALVSKAFDSLVLGCSVPRTAIPRSSRSPNRLDLTREPRHLAFGSGIHYCLGAPLARLEAQVAIGTVLRRFPALALAVERPVWRPSSALRGLEALPVLLESAPA
jgi:cytochrome P450